MTWGVILVLCLYGVIFPDSLLAVSLSLGTYALVIELREWDLRKALKSKDKRRVSQIINSDMTLKSLYQYLSEKE